MEARIGAYDSADAPGPPGRWKSTPLSAVGSAVPMMLTKSDTSVVTAPPMGTVTVPQRTSTPSVMPTAGKQAVGSNVDAAAGSVDDEDGGDDDEGDEGGDAAGAEDGLVGGVDEVAPSLLHAAQAMRTVAKANTVRFMPESQSPDSSFVYTVDF